VSAHQCTGVYIAPFTSHW